LKKSNACYYDTVIWIVELPTVPGTDDKGATADERLRQLVDESLADPRPSVPARLVFGRLRAHHAGQSVSPQKHRRQPTD
jgi:hypothetical protein